MKRFIAVVSLFLALVLPAVCTAERVVPPAAARALGATPEQVKELRKRYGEIAQKYGLREKRREVRRRLGELVDDITAGRITLDEAKKKAREIEAVRAEMVSAWIEMLYAARDVLGEEKFAKAVELLRSGRRPESPHLPSKRESVCPKGERRR